MSKFLELSALRSDNSSYRFILNTEDIVDIYPYDINEHNPQYFFPNIAWQYRPAFWIQYPNADYKTQITLRKGQRHCCLEDFTAILNQMNGIIRPNGNS